MIGDDWKGLLVVAAPLVSFLVGGMLGLGVLGSIVLMLVLIAVISG